MKNFTATTATVAVIAGISAATLGFSGMAAAAPSATGDAQATISQLEAGGHRVIVNKLGSAPLSQADVVDVHTGGNVTQWVNEGGDDGLELVVTGKVYYVTVR
jgi:hypothetical protein